MKINGWDIFAHRAFLLQLFRLEQAVRKRGEKSNEAKLLKWIVTAIRDRIPADPTNDYFRQGDMLGKEHTHWFRDKYARYRLFFRCDVGAQTITLGWVNDSSTLRERGAKTDVYVVFRKMLEKGNPPSEWGELLSQAMNEQSMTEFEGFLRR